MTTKDQIIAALTAMEEEYTKETIVKKDGRDKDSKVIWAEEFDMPANPLTVLIAWGLKGVTSDTLRQRRIAIRSTNDPRRAHSLMSREDQKQLKEIAVQTGMTMQEIIEHIRELKAQK